MPNWNAGLSNWIRFAESNCQIIKLNLFCQIQLPNQIAKSKCQIEMPNCRIEFVLPNRTTKSKSRSGKVVWQTNFPNLGRAKWFGKSIFLI
jgi:hypothetical protein